MTTFLNARAISVETIGILSHEMPDPTQMVSWRLPAKYSPKFLLAIAICSWKVSAIHQSTEITKE